MPIDAVANSILDEISANFTEQPTRIDQSLLREYPQARTSLRVEGPFHSHRYDVPYRVVRVETTITDPDVGQPELEALASANRIALHGAFFDDGHAHYKLVASASIYEVDDAMGYYCSILSRVFAGQAGVASGILNARHSPAEMAEWREALQFDSHWTSEPPPEELENTANKLRTAQRLVASVENGGLVFEIRLRQDSAPSRMFDALACTGLVAISTRVVHPIAGVGYGFTFALPMQFSRPLAVRWADRLNIEAIRDTDGPPVLGAWSVVESVRHGGAGERGRSELVYSGFFPLSHAIDGITSSFALWTGMHAVWFRDNYLTVILEQEAQATEAAA